MRIHTLRVTEYKGIKIYIQQFGHVWQYLFAHKGEIYMQHTIVKAPLLRRIIWKLGLDNNKTPYHRDEMDKLEDMMISGATLSIDALQGIKLDNPVIVPQPSKIPLGA